MQSFTDLLINPLRQALGERVYVFDSIDSTNNYLATATQPALCLAWQQSAARGRGGKLWHSYKGNLALSLTWPFASHPAAQGLSLVAGLALAHCLVECGLKPQIKWPNDLLLGGKKIAGILIETHATAHQVIAIIGVGVNLVAHPPDMPAALPATNLQEELRDKLPRSEKFAAALANHLFRLLVRFTQQGFVFLRSDWLAHACWLGQQVTIGGEHGVLCGVDNQGHAQLATDQGIKALGHGSMRLMSGKEHPE